jgi:hypothetical protein
MISDVKYGDDEDDDDDGDWIDNEKELDEDLEEEYE